MASCPNFKDAIQAEDESRKVYDAVEEARQMAERYPPGWFKGYAAQNADTLYKTTNGDYGSLPPTFHSLPSVFRDRPQKFTNHLGKCGMYRNRSLNTGSDKSVVPEF